MDTKGRENHMTEIHEDAQAAAEWLDSLAGRLPEITPSWRDKIDTDTLSMMSVRTCIIGQLFGHYDTGVTKLKSVDREGFRAHNTAFASYGASWKLIIKAPRISEEIEWMRIGRPIVLREVKNVTLLGKPHVACAGSSATLLTLEGFLRYYAPKITQGFKKGDILKSTDGRNFMYETDNRVISLGSLTWQTLTYWAEEAGPLTLNVDKTSSSLWGTLINRD